MDTDDSYLSLVFNEDIFIDVNTGAAKKPAYEIVVYASHSPESIYEENLNKCFQRLHVDLKKVLKTDRLTEIDTKLKTLIFSDVPMVIEGFPELKYAVSNNVLWFDSLATITLDSNLKVIFWDKFQEMFS